MTARRTCEGCGSLMPQFVPRKTVGGKKVCEGCQMWHVRTAALHNPTGELRGQDPKEWYHGSRHEFEDFGHSGGFHWNTLLGHHFSAQHEIAQQFSTTGDEDDEDDPAGHVVHAKLHIKNPKTYRSEHDMDQEVYEHERAQGNHIDKHLDKPDPFDPHGEYADDEDDFYDPEDDDLYNAKKYKGDSKTHYSKNDQDHGYYSGYRTFHPTATGWLNSHPDKDGIAARFKQRLKDQGHDGIVYGNDFEQNAYDKGGKTLDYYKHPVLDMPEVGQHNVHVPQHSVSAIPFENHQIEVTQHHYDGECKTPAEIADPRHMHVDDRLPPASGPYRQPRLPDTDVTRQPGTPKYKLVQHDVGEEPLTSYGAKHTYTVQRYAPQGGYETVEKEIEGPLYHGGRAKLNAGDLITPGRKPNAWGDEGPKSTHVYFSTDKDTAASYSQQLGNKGHLYEVEPTGEFRTDYGPQDYKTPHPLRVVRKIPREEWQLGSTTASASNMGDPTDWDEHYPTLPDEVHRGMAVKLPAKVRDQLNDAPKADAARVLVDKTQWKATGPHWSTDLGKAREFSQRTSSDWKGEIPVILHAATPAREDIETRPAALRRMEIFPYDHFQQEREVPVRKGREVKVTGLSWKPNGSHPDADDQGWVRHDFPGGRPHTAAHGEQSALNHAGQQDVYPVSTSRGITPMCQYHLSVHQSIAQGANDLAGHLGIPEASVERLGGSEKGTCAECFKNTDYQLKLNRPEGYDRQQQRDSKQPRTRKGGPYVPAKTKPLIVLRQSQNAKSVVSSSSDNGSVRAFREETNESGVIMGSNRRAPGQRLDHLRASEFVQVEPRLASEKPVKSGYYYHGTTDDAEYSPDNSYQSGGDHILRPGALMHRTENEAWHHAIKNWTPNYDFPRVYRTFHKHLPADTEHHEDGTATLRSPGRGTEVQHDSHMVPEGHPELRGAGEDHHQTLFHGTARDEDDDELEYIHPGGRGSAFGTGTSDSNYAYATPRLNTAWTYAEKRAEAMGGRPAVYRVSPHKPEDVEDDPLYHGETSRGNYAGDLRSKSGFHVLDEVPMSAKQQHHYDASQEDDDGDDDWGDSHYGMKKEDLMKKLPSLRQIVAHDATENQELRHCPFCGAGKIIGRQDGTVECEFCHQFFTVQVQPQFPNFPQTIDGQPQQIPGMPGQVETPPGASVPGGGLPPGQEGAEDPAAGGNPFADGDADDAGGPPDGDADDKGDEGGDEPPPFAKKSFRTVTGALLDEEAYARHMALRLSPDRDAMLKIIRQEA